jgi:iron complex outermembrane receptor protein
MAHPHPGRDDGTSIARSPISAATLKPESVTAYEIGYKGRLSDRLNVSVAAFHYIYKDIQVFVYNPIAGNGTQNAAKGRVMGVEMEGSFRASSDLSFNFGVSYLKSKYLKFPDAQAYEPTGGPSCLCGNTSVKVNAKGNRLVHAPSWTANLAMDYSHEFSAGRFGLNVNANYDGGYFFDVNNRVKQKPYALLSAELSFAPSAIKGLRVILWGKNLTDHDYLQSVLQTNFADAVSWSPPRTFGGRVEFAF